MASRKVSMTTTIREALGVGLAEAKQYTNQVVDGEVVVLDLPDREAALALADALHELGADVEIVDGGETEARPLPPPSPRQ
jgi:ribosomal protein L7/L12